MLKSEEKQIVPYFSPEQMKHYTEEPPTTDSPYYGNLHNADKRLRSRIIPYSLLYIATFV